MISATAKHTHKSQNVYTSTHKFSRNPKVRLNNKRFGKTTKLTLQANISHTHIHIAYGMMYVTFFRINIF